MVGIRGELLPPLATKGGYMWYCRRELLMLNWLILDSEDLSGERPTQIRGVFDESKSFSNLERAA
jgi:hypothetical protein